MKYNLNGSANQLRLEICNLQHEYSAIQACNNDLQKFISDESMTGFYIALIFALTFIMGYFIGYSFGKINS